MQADQNFLGDVVRVVRVACLPQRPPVDLLKAAAYELIERLLVAGLGAANQRCYRVVQALDLAQAGSGCVPSIMRRRWRRERLPAQSRAGCQ